MSCLPISYYHVSNFGYLRTFLYNKTSQCPHFGRLMKVSESSFTVKVNIIKDNVCSKAGIVVNELPETFTRALILKVKKAHDFLIKNGQAKKADK